MRQYVKVEFVLSWGGENEAKKIMANLYLTEQNSILRENGPVAHNWPNYSKLTATEYHCHLARKWVACWRMEEGTIEIEVYYAGFRENAPY